jgi:hypothetical protein
MFEGDMEKVTLYCNNSVANVIIDRFGIDVPIIKKDLDHFTVTVNVSVSKLFLGWIMSLPDIKIISPQRVVNQMKTEIQRLQETYK